MKPVRRGLQRLREGSTWVRGAKRDQTHAQAHWRIRGAGAALWLFGVCLAVHGCTPSPQGGAVELSWALRDREKGFVNCATARVATIRLRWGEDEALSDTWPCNNQGEQRGVTGFDVPAGRASLTISPECATGPADPADYEAPPPIVRTFERGGIVTLGAMVIEVDLMGPDNMMKICPTS